MSPLRRRSPAQDEETGARRALDRAVAMLRQYHRDGLTVVSIEDVLTLLGAEPVTVPKEPPRDPRADPLTGAMWAGPPGSAPPPRG